MREVCGACSGMFMVGSLSIPAVDPQDKDTKALNYKLMQDMAGEFKQECGSIICRELLGLDCKKESCVPEERNAEYYKKRPCKEIVRCAAEILEKEFLQVDK